ncbi:hypothetical protein NDU88_001199 [Pleurodeles waltl]|uniref:Uncharacterized protein n=1 Tax=Pleurodeles waltl TaxID=8319 RepID=A0AAV7V9Q0_PLEWA|nr:hypothetical protein NDU88_001199 [Pleurodeles waltl]
MCVTGRTRPTRTSSLLVLTLALRTRKSSTYSPMREETGGYGGKKGVKKLWSRVFNRAAAIEGAERRAYPSEDGAERRAYPSEDVAERRARPREDGAERRVRPSEDGAERRASKEEDGGRRNPGGRRPVCPNRGQEESEEPDGGSPEQRTKENLTSGSEHQEPATLLERRGVTRRV